MIEVLQPGRLDLVVDAGRPGHAASGIPVGGAADVLAFAAANQLVGNPTTAAGLECLLDGPSLRFPRGGVIALVGAHFAATRSSGLPVRWNETLVMGEGERLRLGHAAKGCRCWLAVRGGLRVPVMLGSRSSFLPGGWGGFRGRALRAGDRLPVGSNQTPLRILRCTPTPVDGPLRVIAGPQAGRCEDAALLTVFTGVFRVSPASDRRGVRLGGLRLPTARAPELASQAVLPGTLQIPPDGQPIILGWDGPVTGGYPVVASVISADMARVAQLRPGDQVSFTTVSVDAARAAWIAPTIGVIE